MQSADIPSNEVKRLQDLFDYDVLDTPPEESFDTLTALAATICGRPIALVSLIDEKRQWFKSHHGLDATETPREYAFCAHAIHQQNIFEIYDSREDTRFFDNPLVTGSPNVISYAGAPLETANGSNLGTLCVIGHEPALLSDTQKQALGLLAKQVVSVLELRKNVKLKNDLFQKLMSLTKKIDYRNSELNDFSVRAAHDLSGPIRQISQLAHFCLDSVESSESLKIPDYCKSMIDRCKSLQVLIRDIFELTRAEARTDSEQKISFKRVVAKALNSLERDLENSKVDLQCEISCEIEFHSVEIRLQQVLYNLISNSIKYANPEMESCWVKLIISDFDSGILIKVEDNGLGIPEQYHEKLFKARNCEKACGCFKGRHKF